MATFIITTTGTAPTITLDTADPLLLPTGGNIVLTHPESRDLADVALGVDIAVDTALQTALTAGEVTIVSNGSPILYAQELARIGSGSLTYADMTLANVLSSSNTSGGNNQQMSGTDRLEFGGVLNYIVNGATGLLEYFSNKAHQFTGSASVFTVGGLNAILEHIASGAKFVFDPRNTVGSIQYQTPTYTGILDFKTITASRSWALPDKAGTLSVETDLLPTKSGMATVFAGTPLKSAVTFNTPFADSSYSVSIVGADARSWTVETSTASGFIINTNSNTALTDSVFWIAVKHGETS